jgi:RimJ/RimL family protein N-acetyltransferase
MIIKKAIRSIIPPKARYFIASCIPKIVKINTVVLENPTLIENLTPIDAKFIIREISEKDLELLRKFHFHKGQKSFQHNTLPRLGSPEFIGLAAIDEDSNEIAYLSWIIVKSIPYFEEFGFYMKDGDYLVKDIFVVPEYRHQGLSTRMEQERINYCVRRGNCKRVYTQPLSNNEKGNKAYLRLGYKRVKTSYLLRWYIFNVYRSLSGFIKRPFRKILK